MAKALPGVDLLEDLCARFILNVRADELESFERFMFLVEQAHWFYEDFCRDKDPSLKSLSLREFTSLLIKQCPGLGPFHGMLNEIHMHFNQYKATVPSLGAFLLDPAMEKVLLVRGLKHKHSWGFPKGKIAKDEADMDCAVREVKEETGYDISANAVKDDFIEVHTSAQGSDGQRFQRNKLYIIQGVDPNYGFCPHVKGEIGAFAWFNIADLPCSTEHARQQFTSSDGSVYKFYMVHPFMKQLRAWIRRKRRAAANPKKAKTTAGNSEKSIPKQGSRLDVANGSVHGKKNNGRGGGPKNNAEHAMAPEIIKPKEPGQAWINFRFQQDQILRSLGP